MKVLLIDNDSDTIAELSELCRRCGCEVVVASCHDLDSTDALDFDLIVLSGGYWYDDDAAQHRAYDPELELIRRAQLPMVGICIGMQLMVLVSEGTVPLLDTPQTGERTIRVHAEGQRLLGLPAEARVYKNHTRGVTKVPEVFEVLADSPGHVEIIRHRTLPLVGVQFHPEVGPKPEMKQLFEHLVDIVLAQAV